MAVELKKQLDKEEEMRRTKDDSIKALQGDLSVCLSVFYLIEQVKFYSY